MIRRPDQSSRSISGCPGCFCLCGRIPGAGSLRPHPSMARITGRMDSPGPLRADSRSADSRTPAARGTDDDEAAARRPACGGRDCRRGQQRADRLRPLPRVYRPCNPRRARSAAPPGMRRPAPGAGASGAAGAGQTDGRVQFARQVCSAYGRPHGNGGAGPGRLRPAGILFAVPAWNRQSGRDSGPALSAAWQRENSGFPGAYNSRTPQGVRL